MVMVYNKSIETKKIIVKAYEKLFYYKGYADTSIRDIANEANIPFSNIYYYYKNKKEMAYDLIDKISAQHLEIINEQLNVSAALSTSIELRQIYGIIASNFNYRRFLGETSIDNVEAIYMKNTLRQSLSSTLDELNITLTDNKYFLNCSTFAAAISEINIDWYLNKINMSHEEVAVHVITLYFNLLSVDQETINGLLEESKNLSSTFTVGVMDNFDIYLKD